MQLTKILKRLKLGDVAVRRNPWFYGSARRELAALAAADLSIRREWTEARLRQVMRAAGRSKYGRRFASSEDIEHWPLLEKTLVRADPAALQTGERLTVKASTGGTSGMPLQLVRSLRSVTFEQACIDLMMSYLGVQARSARIAVLRGDDIKDPADLRPPYWRLAAGGERLLLSSNHLTPATVHDYADRIEAFAPDVLWAYPTAIEALCVNLGRSGRELRVPRVLTSSEVLGNTVWALIERTLGSHVVDYYGQAERVAFAYATTASSYRFLPGYAHVELERVASEGATHRYEIIGTSLWNTAMPLVRYRTGDHICLPAAYSERELTEIAYGIRSFDGVLGRDSDILISPEGGRLTGIDHLQRDVANLIRIQVIQEAANDVRILVLAAPEFSQTDSARLLRNARNKLPSSMRVRIERVATLERTALGKTPFVIHRPAVQAQLRTKTPMEVAL